jgi:hypothetical protein
MLRLREKYITPNGELTDAGWQAFTAEFDAVSGGGGGPVAWSDVTGKPSTFPPTPEDVDDRVAALLVAGTNITLTYNDGAGSLTIDAAGGGGGASAASVWVL